MWYDTLVCNCVQTTFLGVCNMENENQKKVILSGIQPSGELTLGSYLGAIKNWVKLSDEYECYYMLADLHSITVRQNPADLRRRTLTQIAAYIACGLDPEKNTIFIQSHVPAHAELGWVLDCYTMFGELSRMTQFKDKSAKNADNINAGLFTYPALMAADILLYQADLVPVGEDQKQHVEICRDIANRFNGVYGETFRIPEPFIPKVGARVMSLTSPGNKMSKSDKDPNGCVYVLEKPEDIMRKFKKAVTDSDTERCVRYDRAEKPGVANLMAIYSAATGKTYEEIEREFDGKGYGAFKPAVGEAVVELFRPIREETERLLADKSYLESVYRAGAEKAGYVSNKTLRKVYKKVGFVAR
ncbi:Tryptophanyl-tRNA synthetase [Intestinimonas butyriciproducens]|uniref:Tryptophan--tRNA ligase n=2 Tax=Intestinimonas butyriciproducens TaxID=1297617 RepID=A0A0S2W4V9_9FIRM|nr:Tryptophanyl-tRNA synthetase [Intestinimonas butyriciproducens]